MNNKNNKQTSSGPKPADTKKVHGGKPRKFKRNVKANTAFGIFKPRTSRKRTTVPIKEE